MARRYPSTTTVAAVLCLVASIVTGCSFAPRNRGIYVPTATGEPPAGQFGAVLWFVGPGGDTVPVTRRLPADRARVWTAVDALTAGPSAGVGLAPALPRGSRLRKVVYWAGEGMPAGVIDLDFDASFGQPTASVTDAISHTLAQFPDINAARILVDGVPAGSSASTGGAEPALLRPAETLTAMQFVPIQAESRLYLAARHVTGIPAATDFEAAVARLIDAEYIRTILPRESKLTWSAATEPDGHAVAVTIELKRKVPNDQDWQAIQVAADALALTLRSIPGTKTITIKVAGQTRSFVYAGQIWPNPEPD